MSDMESPTPLRETSPQPGTPPSPTFPSGRWWLQRHLHVPVVVWIVASVLGGAAIGNALDASVKSEESPTITPNVTIVVSDPGAAVECDVNHADCVPVASDVDCDEVYDLDADNNGIGCD